MSNNKVRYGIQIINWVTDIYVMAVKVMPCDVMGYNLYKAPYREFKETGCISRYQMNGMGVTYFFSLTDAVAHIMAGRTCKDDFPNLVTAQAKVKAIAECQDLFDIFAKVDKVEQIKEENTDLVDEIKSLESMLKTKRQELNTIMNEARINLGIHNLAL